MIEFAFSQSIEGLPPEIHPVYEDDFDRIGWELFFYQLPQEQTELMISMFLGMEPKEIMRLHKYRNMRRYYGMTTKLRASYKEKKAQFLV